MIEMRKMAVMQAAVALRELGRQPMRPAVAMKVLRMSRAVEATAEEVERTRVDIMDRYTERGEDGLPTAAIDEEGNALEGHIKLTDPRAYHQEISALLSGVALLEVEPVTLEELGDDVRISPFAMMALEPLLGIGEEAGAGEKAAA